MVVGDFLDEASLRLDSVVDVGTKDYVIVVSQNPEPEFVCYAVRNKTTFVDEYLSSNLAKVRYAIKEMQKDLDEGYERHTSALLDTFNAGSKPLKGGHSGGGLNG